MLIPRDRGHHLQATFLPVNLLLHALPQTLHHAESHEVLTGDDAHHLVVNVHHCQVSQAKCAKNHICALQ